MSNRRSIGLGLNIYMARKDLEMTQKELAERVPCTRSLLSLLETGKRTPALNMLCCIAAALGCTPSALLNGVK